MSNQQGRYGLILTLAGALLVAAPAAAQIFGGDDLARRQIAEHGKLLEELHRQNEALSQRLSRMDESLKGLGSSNPALELAQQLEMLRQELMQLRGQIEVVGNEVQMASKRQRDMYVDLDSRMKRLEQPGAADAAPAAAPPGAPAAAAAAPAAAGAAAATAANPASAAAATAAPQAASDGEARAYDAAQSQRRIGNYQGAIAAFRNFISQYPKSPLVHRAQYWIGDSYYNLREFRAAIQSQQKLIATYPQSASVPDALLNIASCQLELGETAAARKTLDRLIARYPASEAADKGRRRLATTPAR